MTKRNQLRALTALILLSATAGRASAQGVESTPTPVWGEVFVGSEVERYLRVMQLAGAADKYPWSVRSFGPTELRRLAPSTTGHPWADHVDLSADTLPLALALLRPATAMVLNSSFPYGSNDGSMWAGRGLNASITGGFAVRFRALTVVVAPELVAAQNADFRLTPNGTSGDSIFRDFRSSRTIDLPQRPGDGAFVDVSPGQSTIRVDVAGVAVGLSTANQHWGPVREYPVILGSNAAGFPHLFIGTALPRDLWIGSLHGRVIWGSLSQSPYSPMEESHRRRLMTGVVATFTPRYLDGLELGLGRFYHNGWPEGGVGVEEIRRPFETFFKKNLPDADLRAENQLASVHARWVFPASGLEIYGEFAREDHNHDLRDFLLEPDHVSAYVLGFQRVWDGDPTDWWVFGAEVANSDVTHLRQVRAQSAFYVHTSLRQGHTYEGQLLGSPAIYGGSGAKLSLSRYRLNGRTSFFAERVLRGGTVGAPIDSNSGLPGLDVQLSSGLEAVRFRGRLEFTGGITGTLNLNRGYTEDAFNLNARFGVRAPL